MVTVVYAPGDLRVISVCDGPDNIGQCPYAAVGGEVPCSGLDVALSKEELSQMPQGLRRPRFRVSPGSTSCPLAGRGPTAHFCFCRDYFSPFAPKRL